jgi:hypothetical protein
MSGWSKSLPDLAGPPPSPSLGHTPHPIPSIPRIHTLCMSKSQSAPAFWHARNTHTLHYTYIHYIHKGTHTRSDKHPEQCPEFPNKQKTLYQFENIPKWEWHRMESSRFSRVLKEIDPAPATYPRIRSLGYWGSFPQISARQVLQAFFTGSYPHILSISAEGERPVPR